MAQFTGTGSLIGYRNYKSKDGKTVHVYSILQGTTDKDSKLFNNGVSLINVFQDTQTLAKIAPQAVSFDMEQSTFSGEQRQKYRNVRAI